MGAVVVALAVTIILLSGCIVYLFLQSEQTNGELKSLKRRMNSLEVVLQHKFQCAESERQAILEKLEHHIMNRNQN